MFLGGLDVQNCTMVYVHNRKGCILGPASVAVLEGLQQQQHRHPQQRRHPVQQATRRRHEEPLLPPEEGGQQTSKEEAARLLNSFHLSCVLEGSRM